MTANKEYIGRRFLSKAAVAERYTTSSQTVDRMSRDGRLPRPLYFGGTRFPRWDEAELDEFDRRRTREYIRSERELAGDVKRAETVKAKTTPTRRRRTQAQIAAAKAAANIAV
jgi:predicted DNA-binding transcriptional regulator AlpA